MVAIKGFKMPNSCGECPLNYDTLACMAGDGNPEGPDIDSVTYKGANRGSIARNGIPPARLWSSPRMVIDNQ